MSKDWGGLRSGKAGGLRPSPGIVSVRCDVNESVTDVKRSVTDSKKIATNVKKIPADIKKSVTNIKKSITDTKKSITDTKIIGEAHGLGRLSGLDLVTALCLCAVTPKDRRIADFSAEEVSGDTLKKYVLRSQ